MKNIKVFSSSLQGVRPSNEDKHIIFEKDNCKIYCIFDGHGGKEVSTLLSKIIPQNLYNIKKITLSSIKKLYDKIQNYIKQQSYANTAGSTACIVILYIDNITTNNQINKPTNNQINKPINNQTNNQQQIIKMFCINVGDSRCVLYYDNKIFQMSEDHKPTNINEMQRITKMGGKVRRDGLEYRIGDLSVSRAFGDCNNKYTYPTPEITTKILNKSCFFIIGCDGLFDVLNNNEICFEVNNWINKNRKSDISKVLAQQAIKSGSSDNVSDIVVIIEF